MSILPFLFLFGSLVLPAYASEFNLGASMSSDSFRVLDAQHSAFGATSSSSSPSFHIVAVVGDTAVGSSSAATFGLQGGSLAFPTISAPIISEGTVTTTQGGFSLIPGIANGGLTISENAVTVQIKDFYGNVIGESNILSLIPTITPLPTATPTPTSTPAPTPTAAGGGGQIGYSGIAQISTFFGRKNNKPDLNGDGKVNIADFSILAFYWHRTLPLDSPYDLNGDGQVTLADFSLLAFYWTR